MRAQPGRSLFRFAFLLALTSWNRDIPVRNSRSPPDCAPMATVQPKPCGHAQCTERYSEALDRKRRVASHRALPAAPVNARTTQRKSRSSRPDTIVMNHGRSIVSGWPLHPQRRRTQSVGTDAMSQDPAANRERRGTWVADWFHTQAESVDPDQPSRWMRLAGNLEVSLKDRA